MCNVSVKLASHAGVFRRARISSLPTRKEIRAPRNRSFNIPPSPGHTAGIWNLCRPGEEGIDYQSLPRGGEFDPHVLRVGNLNCTLDFMRNLWRGELSWGTWCWRNFHGTDCAFVANLCRIWRYLNFNIFNIGFRLWIYECIKLCS